VLENSELLGMHTLVSVEKRVNELLRDCHELSIATCSEAILLFVIDTEVSWEVLFFVYFQTFFFSPKKGSLLVFSCA
jgi:hypothetical protein